MLGCGGRRATLHPTAAIAGTVARVDAEALDHALAQAPDIGDACRTVATALAEDGRLAVAVYVGRAGRLRCLASSGAAHVLDGVSASSGPVGAAAATGEEQHTPQLGAATAVSLPLRSGHGDVMGVLAVEGGTPLDEDRLDGLRRVARELADRISVFGGPPAEGHASRLAQHAAALAGMEDPARIERATLVAALDLAGMESAALFRAEPDGTWSVAATAGVLGARLALLGLVPLDGLAMLVEGGGSCSLTREATRPDSELPLGLGALREAGARTAIIAPLLARGRMLGLLVLADTRALEPSTERAELVELIAVQSASNLRTAAAVADLRHRASTDPLTGLGHRGAFGDALGASHRRPIATAVALCDIDNFKALNDRFGHQEGDRALVATVNALEGALRRGDLLFRLGGDEFAALLAVRNEREALAAGQRMRAAVAASDAGVTVSVGVAVSGPEESDDSLVGRADRALYAAKHHGRDRVALDDVAPDEPAAAPSAGGAAS